MSSSIPTHRDTAESAVSRRCGVGTPLNQQYPAPALSGHSSCPRLLPHRCRVIVVHAMSSRAAHVSSQLRSPQRATVQWVHLCGTGHDRTRPSHDASECVWNWLPRPSVTYHFVVLRTHTLRTLHSGQPLHARRWATRGEHFCISIATHPADPYTYVRTYIRTSTTSNTTFVTVSVGIVCSQLASRWCGASGCPVRSRAT